MIDNINWYPGHMKKTREMIQENLKLVDLVMEIVDSRIPMSSRNPVVDKLVADKKRMIVLNKSDLSDSRRTEEWKKYFEAKGNICMVMNSQSGDNIKKLFKMLNEFQKELDSQRSIKKPIRMMIVGVPNVGKSSIINRMTGKKSARIGDKPGVTKGKQWLTLSNGMQLLDTPGILWPKFDDQNVGLNLAFCGSIKDEILGISDLAYELIKIIERDYPESLKERFRLDEISEETIDNMDAIAKSWGFIMSGKRLDYERTGRAVLDEFRSGRLGKITLEEVSSNE